MAKLQSQQETWGGLVVNGGSWINGFNTAQISVATGQMVITLPSSSTNYHGYDSSPNATLVDSSYSCQLVNAGNLSLASLEVYPVQLILDTNNKITFYINNNNVAYLKKVAGVQTISGYIAYNAIAMQYFRIRESNGTVYWEYGPDGIEWTILFQDLVTNLFAITSLYNEISAGTYALEVSGTSVTLDNINYTPTNKPGNYLPHISVGNGMGRSEGAT